MDFEGFRVITSPYAPKGKVLIFDQAALDSLFKLEAPSPIFHSEPEWSSEFKSHRFTAMSAAFAPKQVERDPMETYGLPRSVRAWWRLAKALVGYEFRKAAGTPRRYPVRSVGLITGLAA